MPINLFESNCVSYHFHYYISRTLVFRFTIDHLHVLNSEIERETVYTLLRAVTF